MDVLAHGLVGHSSSELLFCAAHGGRCECYPDVGIHDIPGLATQ